MPKKICIIVPCYNEANRLAVDVYLSFLKENPDMDICFVNDGSTDDTWRVLENMQSLFPDRILAVNKKPNQGKAEAVRSGIIQVSEKNTYEWVGFMDADLATPLPEVYRLARVLETEKNAVVVMGSRIKRMGVKVSRKPLRHYMGRIFATVVGLLFRLNAYDTQCGAKIFTTSVAREIFARPFHSPWLFDVELLLRIRQGHADYNVVVKEIPLDRWEEKGGSKIRFSHLLKMPFELYTIYRKYH